MASIKTIATEALRHRELFLKKPLCASVSLWLHKKLATEAQRTQSVTPLRIRIPDHPVERRITRAECLRKIVFPT